MAMDQWRTRPYTGQGPLSQIADRMFEQAFAPFFTTSRGDGDSTGFQSLAVTIWETTDAYHVAALAPGLDQDSLHVTVEAEALAIEGELKLPAPEDAQTVWQEFGPTQFRRTLRLGSGIDPTQVEARYQHGMLYITIAKAEQVRPRQVRVQVAGPEADAEVTPRRNLKSGAAG